MMDKIRTSIARFTEAIERDKEERPAAPSQATHEVTRSVELANDQS